MRLHPTTSTARRFRELVLDRILKDGMDVQQTLVSLRREFLLDLPTGLVYDVLYDRAAQLDMAAHRGEVMRHFRGTLCVDELHLGRLTLLLATDPLSDLPVAFPDRRQRSGSHAAVPQEPQGLGLGSPVGGDRRLEALSRPAGRTLARGGASVVRLPRPRAHQQAGLGCRRRRTLVRFVVLKLAYVWGHWSPPEAKAEMTSQPNDVRRREPPHDEGLQPRRVA
jgi:hypothetical protein